MAVEQADTNNSSHNSETQLSFTYLLYILEYRGYLQVNVFTQLSECGGISCPVGSNEDALWKFLIMPFMSGVVGWGK